MSLNPESKPNNLTFKPVLAPLVTGVQKTSPLGKLFCPPHMIRCDNYLPYFNYYTVWKCRICNTFLLRKESALNHSKICKLSVIKEKDIPTKVRK